MPYGEALTVRGPLTCIQYVDCAALRNSAPWRGSAPQAQQHPQPRTRRATAGLLAPAADCELHFSPGLFPTNRVCLPPHDPVAE